MGENALLMGEVREEWPDWATVTQLTILYKCGEEKSISKHTTCQTLRLMGYNCIRSHWAKTHSHCIGEDWGKKLPGLMNLTSR